MSATAGLPLCHSQTAIPTPTVILSSSVSDGHTLPSASNVVGNCGRQHGQHMRQEQDEGRRHALKTKLTCSPDECGAQMALRSSFIASILCNA